MSSVAVGSILFFTAFIISPVSIHKPVVEPKPIPEKVMKIAEKTCVKCHTEPGNMMALMHLNLTNWGKYSAEKQAGKAKDMCKMVTKGKMPPKKFLKENPSSAPSQAEIKTICNWAASIQMKKK